LEALTKRFLTSIILVPLVVAAIWFDEPLPWLTLFVLAWGGLAVYEFYKLVAATKVMPFITLGIVGTVLFIVSPYLDHGNLGAPLLAGFMIITLLRTVLQHEHRNGFAAWIWTLAGVLYVGWFLSHMVALRDLEMGREWVLLAFIVTFASDSAAYLIGSKWGHTRLAPSISPSKTWEGAIAGVFAAAIVSALLGWLLNLPLNYLSLALLGLAVSILGQFGDLAESVFKRNMGTKDSGVIIPGHGGFLDRMDSILFAGVAVYYVVIWFVQ
jgi:phosphatidate cytidylyltransferase